MLNQDSLREATRLTRSGQLVEATALLQRMLRGENAPAATEQTTGRRAPASERKPPTIDAKAHAAQMRRPRRTVRSPEDLTRNLPGYELGGR